MSYGMSLVYWTSMQDMFFLVITSLKESMVSVLISNLIINLKSQVHKGISQDIESLSNH